MKTHDVDNEKEARAILRVSSALSMKVYHCSHDGTMTDSILQVPEDAVLKGLFFSESPQDHYGEEIYRAYIPGRDSLLHDGVVQELAWRGEVEWTKDRDGNVLNISQALLENACMKAMDDLSIDPDLFEDVWNCAIVDSSCSPNESLEDEWPDNADWKLQNVRGLTAQHTGLMGAEMEDDTGKSIMLMGNVPLEKVKYDDEHELADEDGFVVIAGRAMRTNSQSDVVAPVQARDLAATRPLATSKTSARPTHNPRARTGRAFEVSSMNQNDATEKLFEAITAGDLDAMRAALDAGADSNAADEDEEGFGETPLRLAVDRADHDGAALLLECGADVNAVDDFGETVLMKAAFAGDTEMARLLLDRGADVNAVDDLGETVLMKAAPGGTDTVRLLLDAGADVNAQDEDGLDALAHAENWGHTTPVALEVAALLRAVQEAHDLAATLPPAHASTRCFEDLGAPDPQPVRSNRPRL